MYYAVIDHPIDVLFKELCLLASNATDSVDKGDR